jgi:MFS transporter, SP family, arabinose:H+ symporter
MLTVATLSAYLKFCCMKNNSLYIILIAFTAAIGGFLLGFDGSVISGAAPFYKAVFGLQDGSVLFGFSVSCIIWGSIFGNLFAGPLSDRIGRKPALLIAAILFIASSLLTALANGITVFIIGRIVAGVAVGVAIIVAPVYIAEVAPAKKRGWLVSFNQLLIVIGLSAAYFSNYFILKAINDPLTNWRWMLGIEAVPSVLYFLFLLLIPESPRWLIMHGKDNKAMDILTKVSGRDHAQSEFENIKKTLLYKTGAGMAAQAKELFTKKMKLILVIGFGLAIFQQLSGINAILYYAPMIFETAGGGRDTAFMQAVVLGLVFMVLTIASMFFIDRLGRKPLLYAGVAMMALSLLITGIVFKNARYIVEQNSIINAANEIVKEDVWVQTKKQFPALVTYSNVNLKDRYAEVFDKEKMISRIELSSPEMKTAIENKNLFIEKVTPLAGKIFENELDFYGAVRSSLQNTAVPAGPYLPLLLKSAIHINPMIVLISILGFIAGFSISLGPVMWAMFSEIFPNRLRGLAISVVGAVNAVTSFLVATLFPMQLNKFGSSATYFIYAGFMFLCLWFVWKYVVETKGKSLEEIEHQLVK